MSHAIAPLPADEPDRLATLHRIGVLDTLPEADFDDLTRVAAAVCGVPIALVSLIDAHRQWFKARVGVDATETPRDVAFCAHAIHHRDLFIVADASADPRFRDNPLVAGDPHIRFYAGAPLVMPEGHALGTLCVIDRTPRDLTPAQAGALRVLGRQVVAQLVLRREVRRLEAEVEERGRVEASLRASEAKFKTVVDRLAEGVYLVDNATGRVVDPNTALLAMLGYTADEAAWLTVDELIAGEDEKTRETTRAAARRELAAAGRCSLGHRKYRRKDGSLVDVEVRLATVPGGAAGFTSVIVRDVTEQLAYEDRLFQYQLDLEEANTRLKSLAVTDGLTGIRNRAAFNDALGEEFERSARHGRPLSVVLMDVDHFKAFNDGFGHPAGDDVLRTVAGVIRRTARATDVVARYGGEEFALVLPDTDLSGAMVLAERCRRAIAAARWDQRPVTISVGVATLGPTTPTPEALVQHADEALYASKRGGRNRVTHRSGVVPTPAGRG